MKQAIIKDVGGQLTAKYYENSIQKIPTSANITLYDNSGTVLLASTPATIGSDGTMSYTVLSAVANEIRYNCKALWSFVVATVTKTQTVLFDMVIQTLANPVVDIDIIKRAPFVKEMNYRFVGTASAGTTSTIVCNDLADEDDYWTSGTVEITAGPNTGEIRKVIDYVASTKTLTVDAVYGTAITTASKFVLIRSFDLEIAQAFSILVNDLFLKGIKTNKILDNEQIREMVIIKTLHLICYNFSKDPVDIWMKRADDYAKNYADMLSGATFLYDVDDDGNIDDDETGLNLGQVRAIR